MDPNGSRFSLRNLVNRLWNAAVWPLPAIFGTNFALAVPPESDLPLPRSSLSLNTATAQPIEIPRDPATNSNNIPAVDLLESVQEEQNVVDNSLQFISVDMDNSKGNACTSAGADRIDRKVIDQKQIRVASMQQSKGRAENEKGKNVQKDEAQNSSGAGPSSSKRATVVRTAEEEAQAMAALKDVLSLYQQLKVEWAKKPVNLEVCRELLDRLKVGLTFLMFLPTSNTTASQQELLLARDILEIGAQWSIAVKDIPSFERYMAQLKCYYLDYREQLTESAFKYQLLGLNLLFLLSQNRVAEFHTELELLPSDQIQSNVYIRHPLSLEQYLMEGSYNKIFLAKGNVPAESYNFFMDILLDTIRNEIAACLEKAYEKISLKEATRMLNLPNQQAMKEYGTKKKWTLGRDNYYYFNTVEAKTENVLASCELAEQAINYARELEMIV